MKIVKNTSILLFLTIVTITFNHKAFAQVKYRKGYVIQLKGDTLKGEIESNSKKEFDNFRKIKFRASAGMPVKSFNASKLKEYRMDSIIFISRKIDDLDVFIKQILTGTHNLYEGRTEETDGKETSYLPDYFYTKSDETILIQDKPSKFKKQMIAFMSDNKEIVKALEEEKYNYASVIELFKAYNK